MQKEPLCRWPGERLVGRRRRSPHGDPNARTHAQTLSSVARRRAVRRGLARAHTRTHHTHTHGPRCRRGGGLQRKTAAAKEGRRGPRGMSTRLLHKGTRSTVTAAAAAAAANNVRGPKTTRGRGGGGRNQGRRERRKEAHLCILIPSSLAECATRRGTPPSKHVKNCPKKRCAMLLKTTSP